MYLKRITPILVKLDIATQDQISQLKSTLTFKDKSAEYDLAKYKKMAWLRTKIGSKAFDAEVQKRQDAINHCLLTWDDGWSVPSGLVARIRETIPGTTYDDLVVYPGFGVVPWAERPPKMRYYQEEALEALLAAKHGAVSMATGTGKSLVILNLCKRLGMKAVVITPSLSIAEQIYDDFYKYFGKRYVGRYYGGKKEAKKLFVIGVAQSLTRLDKDHDDFSLLSSARVCIFDESHSVPAETVKKVAFDLLARTPYRFFVSATQLRGDGKDLLLEGIIGPIVYDYPVQKAVQDGFLSPMTFKVYEVESNLGRHYSDPNESTRAHLLFNPAVCKQVAEIANNAVSCGRKVLILIDEIGQFVKLAPLLTSKYQFAHGGNLTAEQKEKIVKEFHKSDPNDLVKRFNQGEFPVLIGTSCVSTGTDTKAVDFLIYFQGGKSEVQVRQAIGRGSRIFEGKTDCVIVDFDVVNNGVCHRHAKERVKIYQTIGSVEVSEWRI
jgi:superfamily II DNA or RNA helicase